MTSEAQAVIEAENYYDSSAADAFYRKIWGGEDIHIGLYNAADEDIAAASRRTVEMMAALLQTLDTESRVIDLGAGLGGAARYLARTAGCHVTCLNLSDNQNDHNRRMTKEAGLDDRVDVLHGNFEDLPADDESFDIAWSQDAFLHSGNRVKVLDEIARTLKPGGELIFTDPMQAVDCPAGVLQPILDRIHLETFASVDFYRVELEKRGFETVCILQLPQKLCQHYSRVAQILSAQRDEVVALAGEEYVETMLNGLGHWVEGADKGYLDWGILHFRKRA